MLLDVVPLLGNPDTPCGPKSHQAPRLKAPWTACEAAWVPEQGITPFHNGKTDPQKGERLVQDNSEPGLKLKPQPRLPGPASPSAGGKQSPTDKQNTALQAAEYCLAIERNGVLTHDTVWKDLENTTGCERSQAHEATECVSPFT